MRCGCPCRREFDPSHDRQRYIDARHRQAAYRDRVKTTARANGVPDHLNLQTARGTRLRNGDAQTRRAPSMRLSYYKTRDAIAAYFQDPVADGRSFRADQILRPLLTAKQLAHLDGRR